MESAALQDRTVVITGASRGLGAGLAEEFERLGLRLGLCARNEPVLPDGERVHAARLDVADAPAMDRFAARVEARFSKIDLWINNAGVLAPISPLRDIESAAFLDHLRINVLGVFNGTRAFVRHVRSRAGGGVLVNLSSGAAQNAYAGWSAYCAAKAAVDRLTECVQLEEAAQGLRAYALSPGLIDTQMQEQIRECREEVFPSVEKFRQAKRDEAFNRPAFVARHLLEIAFKRDPAPAAVVYRVPLEREG
jgi:NAD(P)-dependent dehydrogenase (short-subunit alcohol dehydrogenase family)